MERNIFQEIIIPLQSGNPIEVIRHFQQNKLIKEKIKCETCEETMNWTQIIPDRKMVVYLKIIFINHLYNCTPGVTIL